MVPRARLIERLNEGLKRRPGLSLVSAPAGFGKTTLVTTWLTGGERGVAWLSLDEGDNDPARFLTYVVAAVQTIAANVGAEALGMLQSPQLPPSEAILTALLNDLARLPDDLVLVLDDYHVIEAPLVDQALGFLVEHLPPQLHLVITTREDPQLPLARLRARGQLTELRAADLRFTAAEAAEFLNTVMGLSISAADVAALEDRTEGWIAGLQLAALSMQGQQDVAAFIQAFAGDHRYIVDYLVAEVLERQPEAVRRFLLQTAILDRLSGPLCDAVTGQEGGGTRLEALERGNFFVIPLDDRRQWYRYHHLFADVLRAHLRAEQPEQVASLHRRASDWYALHDSAGDAIRHALAAEDFGRAADLVERAVPAMSRSRQESVVLGWLRALPDDMVRARPVLCFHYAWALLTMGELESGEARLQEVERWLDTRRERLAAATPEKILVDEAELLRLPGWIAVQRAALAHARGDVAGTVKDARRALDLLPADDYLWRGAAASILGLAAWASGDLEAAGRSYTEGMANVRRAGNLSDAIGCAIALADIRIAQGRLAEAMRTYEQALQLALGRDGPVLRGTADVYIGMSELLRERNDLSAATEHLRRSQALGERAGLPQYPYRWRVAQARIQEAQGDWVGALELLQEAQRVYVSDYLPDARPVAAWKTRGWVAQGRLREALGWVREQGLSVDDELSYLAEFKHITLARVLLARHPDNPTPDALPGAVRLLARLLQAAEAGQRTASVIEILVLQALAHRAQGRLPAALEALERALTLAEPEGYVRMFVDEGPPLAAMLAEATKKNIAPNYVRQLLAAFGGPDERAPVKQTLVEPLTRRELDLLRLLATGLTGPEIADKLMVSLNTVRTHTRSVYAKLEVNDRRAAVRRAEELGLL
ncbi:MAG: LuxR C-terminal-related transcriptional regulator [Anaerolineales bacterium]